MHRRQFLAGGLSVATAGLPSVSKGEAAYLKQELATWGPVVQKAYGR
jgi:hypothetical protein